MGEDGLGRVAVAQGLDFRMSQIVLENGTAVRTQRFASNPRQLSKIFSMKIENPRTFLIWGVGFSVTLQSQEIRFLGPAVTFLGKPHFSFI